MEKKSTICVKLNADDKAKADAILKQLGVTHTMLIRMFYKQIILTHSIPLRSNLSSKPAL